MMARKLPLLTLAITLALIPALSQPNEDLTVSIILNGVRVEKIEDISLEPGQDVNITYILTAKRDIVLKSLKVIISGAGIEVPVSTTDLGDKLVKAGQSLKSTIIIQNSIPTPFGDTRLSIVTGIYKVRSVLEYQVLEEARSWENTFNLKIPGIASLASLATLIVLASGVSSVVSLARYVYEPPKPGSIASANARMSSLKLLEDWISDRIEPATRGRLISLLTREIERRIRKEYCPLCGNRVKKGFCKTDGLSIKEARQKYKQLILNLVEKLARGLMTRKKVVTLSDVKEFLNVDERIATDVLSVMSKGKLVSIKGLGKKVAGKAVKTGINSALSYIMLVTVGGLQALSFEMLVIILVASIFVPLIIAKAVRG